jgi:hypothetical protein
MLKQSQNAHRLMKVQILGESDGKLQWQGERLSSHDNPNPSLTDHMIK